MNILLTGATGFVGKALYRELITQKYNPTCVFRKRHKTDRLLSEFATGDRCFVDHVDGNTPWSACLKGIDQVVHLAGLAHTVNGDDPDPHRHFFSVNHEGTSNLAAQAARHGVQRFIFMSSIMVNGKTSTAGPFCETDRANPQNAYAAAKFAAEKSLEKIGADTGMEVVILRPPLVYGPYVKANFLKLLDLVYSAIPLPFGAVSNKRSFVCLENLVDAVCLCICHEKAANQTFMVSDHQDLSTTQLIQKIAAAMGRKPRLVAVPEKYMKSCFSLAGLDHMYDRLWGNLQVDASKIQMLLGWKPRVTVDQGIMKTVQWYLATRRHKRKLKVQV
jgi:nucleoside-diphosphate-sugar epimerase